MKHLNDILKESLMDDPSELISRGETTLDIFGSVRVICKALDDKFILQDLDVILDWVISKGVDYAVDMYVPNFNERKIKDFDIHIRNFMQFLKMMWDKYGQQDIFVCRWFEPTGADARIAQYAYNHIKYEELVQRKPSSTDLGMLEDLGIFLSNPNRSSWYVRWDSSNENIHFMSTLSSMTKNERDAWNTIIKTIIKGS